MATSLFYQLDDSSSEVLSKARTKDQWYEALHQAGASEAPCLQGEDSLPMWERAILDSKADGPIGSLFSGNLGIVTDNSFDPHVAFHGATATAAIALDLKQKGREFFRRILSEHAHEGDIWLYEPMIEFFERAAREKCAVVVLWGN